jgi:hypothetical protein
MSRPKSPNSMTTAQRQAKYRASHVSVKVGDRMAETIRSLAAQFGMDQVEVVRELVRFSLCNRNWKLLGFPCAHKEEP